MQNKQLIATLKEIGLTENESKVYLHTLSLGPTTALSIARSASIQRTTVYTVIESLKKKGLIHTESKGLKQLFVAEHPDRLDMVLEERKNKLKKAFPELLALHNLQGGDSTVKYYEGITAIKSLYDELIAEMNPHEFYLVISDLQKFFDRDRQYVENFLKKRITARIRSRLISTESEQAHYMKKHAKQMDHELRFIPKNRTISVDIVITPHRLTMFNLSEPLSAVSIKNPTIIKAHREMFEIIWDSLPE
jgi:sugar-specific transcriptional regulator TrmB